MNIGDVRVNGQHELWDYINEIYAALYHASYIFPSDTNLTCTLTAAETANTWSSWAEIEDDTGGTTLKFSAAFASEEGHITELHVETLSEVNTVYMVQLSYGSGKVHLGEFRLAGGTKFDSAVSDIRTNSIDIPAGETVYYRMKSATGVADTAIVHFRWHLHV